MPVVDSSTGSRPAPRRAFIAVAAAAAACVLLAWAASAKASPTSGNAGNPNATVIPNQGNVNPTIGPSDPFPSDILVRNLYPHVTKVTATFSSLSHTFSSDIDALLVGPQGQNVILMSDVGGSHRIRNVHLTFDDAAPSPLPTTGQIVSGSYRPTNNGANDPFDPPAPPGLTHGTSLSTFNGTNPNGTWHLFIRDDSGGDVGQLIGWSLHIDTAPNAGRCANGITGTSGRDVLDGGGAGDRIRGLGGDDLLRGDGGRDCISGSSGNDTISGGSGNDRISGGSGNDRIFGRSGNDRINAVDGTRDGINCGSGRHDRARVDRVDRVRGCEIVRRV